MDKESERRIWEKVSCELMTNESDMSDGTIVRHCLCRVSRIIRIQNEYNYKKSQYRHNY